MIPIKLEIQGLYSYKETQSIDFSQLTAAGLFGIFGAVGSGKSSILEAILLALYGSTERLSDRGEKTSMLNLQSETLLITFEFRAGPNHSKTYLARYSAKRNPKNFEDVRPAEHTFYEKRDGILEPLTQRAEELVGMKKEHFKQTVIIPQGKFREFIDLTPGPRAEMMKELFGLERFDLSSKTGSLLKVVKEEKIRLETQLLALENYSKEILEEKEIQIKEIAFSAEQFELAFIAAETQFSKQEVLQTKNQQLQGYLKEWSSLEEKRAEIVEKKNIWKDFLRAKTYLKPVWNLIKEKQSDLEKFRVSVTDCSRFKEAYELEIAKLEEEELRLKERAEQKSNREAKIRDLKKVMEIQNLMLAVKEAQFLVEKLQPEIEAKTNWLKELESDIKKNESSAEQIALPDLAQMAELKSAIRDWNQWEAQLTKMHSEFKALEASGFEMAKVIQELEKQLPLQKTSFESWNISQKHLLGKLEMEREKLQQKTGLATHLHLLTEGEACPLCGSTTHPHPIEDQEEEAELKANLQEIEAAKILLENITKYARTHSEQKIRFENQLHNQSTKLKDLEAIQSQLGILKESLKAKNLHTKEALSGFIQQTDAGLEKKEALLLTVKASRKKAEESKTALERETIDLRTAEQKLMGLVTTISAKKEEIKDTLFCKPFFEKEADIISQTIQKVQRDIEETTFLLEGKQKVLRETRSKQATNLADLKNFEKSVIETENKIQELKEEFEALKQTHGFQDESALIALFHHSLDADKVDAEIRQFEDRSLLVKSKLEELRGETGVSEFSPETFEQFRSELSEKKLALNAIKKEFTLLDQDIKESKLRWEEKQLLQKKYGKLENRESNLKELDGLFKGNGFVKYVSLIYLKELCNTANLRFMKLTKNSLSLEIDDNNTFWVIDYLNGGKRRLLKTLSGGQTFQASLCLALALAEKVKSLNQADQSFFFLDEGFGALDKSALRVVFETLKSLRHENRIVGIISHVEELQQEIEVHAKVVLDPEKGSQVGYSF
ncbi:SMC family ATPase [Rhodonellum sp.]|uniref:SbcC/MukB-like Walker B domain-containing protein n=1 Tax=Rhodonellum sp. TaxID=2231180 RepID=UPI002724BB56|nr:SMC family ATPase [Rhodonellum sp.]MDO9552342.1 SMC family ATPase [Rhodonellum sp.]